MKKQTNFTIILLAFLLAACNAPTSEISESSAKIWIDQPLNNSTLMLGNNIFKVSLTIPIGESNQINLLLNGQDLGQVFGPTYFINTGEGYGYHAFEHAWQAEVPGSYLLEARHGNFVTRAAFAVEGPADIGPEQDVPEQEEVQSESEAMLYAVPLQNANCRLGCSSEHFDIVDTLFEGDIYMPLSGGDGWLLFRGPVAERRCWAASSLFDLQYGGESLSVEQASEMALFSEGPSCPAIPTATPAATATPSIPQCNDGIDNDGDGAIDYISGDGDLQCDSDEDDDEAN